jgi:hypothetical protein
LTPEISLIRRLALIPRSLTEIKAAVSFVAFIAPLPSIL